MSFFTLCGVCLVILVATLVLRSLYPGLSFALGIAATCLLIPAGLSLVYDTLAYVAQLSAGEQYGTYLQILFKAVGIGLVSVTVGDLCRDCGEPGLAGKLEFCARCAMLGVSLPAVKELMGFGLSLL